MSSKLRRLVYNDGVNTLPYRTLSLLFMLVLLSGMQATMCFSFLPKLVKSFGVSEQNTGRYSGYIASSVFVGVGLTALVWGYVADHKGHKKTLLVSSCGMTITTLFFGFSFDFYWALGWRFAQGLTYGTFIIEYHEIKRKQKPQDFKCTGIGIRHIGSW